MIRKGEEGEANKEAKEGRFQRLFFDQRHKCVTEDTFVFSFIPISYILAVVPQYMWRQLYYIICYYIIYNILYNMLLYYIILYQYYYILCYYMILYHPNILSQPVFPNRCGNFQTCRRY